MSPDAVILCYHAVSEDWPNVGAIGPATLERQVRHLLRRGYEPRTLSAAFAGDSSSRALVVTFDDAFDSVLERGLPVLERLGVPATLFVPTDYVAEQAPLTWSTLAQWRGTPFEPELRCMGWSGVRRLAAAGWEIGAHTCSHPDLTAICQERAAAELEDSRAACQEALQQPCPTLAYPFGAHDEEVVRLTRAAGYGLAVTLGTRLLEPRVRTDPLRLSREGIYRTTGWPQFLAATSVPLGRLRASRAARRLSRA
ncbi:MAG: polysaccharide deacetylase family protein [Solirubrobacterales bacterium]